MKNSIKLLLFISIAICLISLVLASVGITINTPSEAGLYYNANFTAQVTTNESTNCTFWTDSNVQTTAANMTNASNATHSAVINVAGMNDGLVTLSFNCSNSTNSSDWNTTNRTFTVDKTLPNIHDISKNSSFMQPLGLVNLSFNITEVNANFTDPLFVSVYIFYYTNGTVVKNFNLSTGVSCSPGGLSDEQDCSVVWNGTDDAGSSVSNAIYQFNITVSDFANNSNTTNLNENLTVQTPISVGLVYPNNESFNTSNVTLNYTVNINANCTTSVWNATGDMYSNGSVINSGILSFDMPSVDDGNYSWNVFCFDTFNSSNNASGNSSVNWTFMVNATGGGGSTPISVALVSPANDTTFNTRSFTLNYTVNILANCTTSVWNDTGDMYSDGTVNNTSGSLGFDMSDVDDGTYEWNVYCVDATNGSNDGWGNSTNNLTFTVDAGEIDVVKNSTNDTYEINDIVTYSVNITNTLSRNLTDIWLEDFPDIDLNFTNQSNCVVYNFSNGGNDSYVNINVTACIGGDLEANQSYTVYLNFTAISGAPDVMNIVEIEATDTENNNFSVNSTRVISINEQEPQYDNGLNEWQSSIVSPYVIKDVPKLLNFSLYRQASDSSCLNNLSIVIPANFTFHGYTDSSVGSGNYTFSENGNTLFWNATTNDFFCGRGPENFIINVSSDGNYTDYSFQVSASSDNMTSDINLTVFTTTTFWYNGTVYDKYSQPLEGAVASLVVLSFGEGGDVSVGTFTDTTDSNGIFNITGVPGLNASLGGPGGPGAGDMGGLFFRLTAVKYNDSDNHYGMYIGPSLPELPESELRSQGGLADPDIYLKEAVTFHIQVEGYDYQSGPTNDSLCNESGCPNSAFNWTYLGYNYGLKDKRMGFPVSSEHSTQSTERYICAPRDRNYSLMVFPSSSFPIYVDFESIETNCNDSGYDLSTTGVNATCTITNGTYLIDAVIAANMTITTFNGSVNMTGLASFAIIPYMFAMGEMIFDQDTLPFNMGQMMRWPTNNTEYDDSYNKTSGEYSIFLPATEAHSDILLMAFVEKDGIFYHDIFNLSAEGQTFSVADHNFTMRELINGTDINITSNNISSEWDETTLVTTKAVQFNLVSNGTLLSTESSFIEMKLEIDNIEYMRMTNAAEGVFTLPVIEGEAIKKLTIYSQSYAPISTPISAEVLNGTANTSTISCSDGVCNISMVGFGDFDPFGEDAIIMMDFYKSNSSCDVPNPPVGCNMMGDTNESMNSSIFSPLKAILMGDVSLRITSGNISVHYVKTDLLASGPPDAAFSENFTGSDINAAWKFGSQGPEIYDEILLSVPYEDALINGTIVVTIPVLYDNEFNPVWNRTAGSTITDIQTNSSLEDYLDYLGNSYEAYLNGTGVMCSETDENLTSGLCYKDTAHQVIWMKIPHFSGVGTVVANFSLYNASLVIWDETDDNTSLPFTNQTREVGDQVIFFANYTNRTSDEELNDSEGLCVIAFATAPNGPYNMAWNTTNTLWQYNRSFNSTGAANWNVTCNSSEYQTLFATDTVNITDVTAPTVSNITPTSVDEDTSTNFTANVSDDVGVSSCTLIINGVDNGSMTITTGVANRTVTFATPGKYNLTANCTDAAGNYNDSTVTSVNINDATNPVVVLVNSSFNTTDNITSITFNYTDEVSVTANCTLYFDGVNVSTNESVDTNTNTVLTSTEQSDGEYSVYVNCTDGDINTGQSGIITVIIDNAGPSVSAIQPTSGDEDSAIDFNATVSDVGVGVSSCNLFINGVDNGSMTITAGVANRTVTFANPGAYNLTANCTDALGNYNGTETTSVTINDATIPTVNMLNSSFSTADNTTSITFNFTDDLSLTANCSLYFDGVSVANNASVDNNTNSILTSTPQSDGAYSVYVNCTDNLSNTGQSGSITVTIDTTAPSVTLNVTASDDNTSVGRNWAYQIAYSTENINGCKFQWNGANESGDISGMTCYKNKTGLADQNYTYKFWVNDALGNWGSTGYYWVQVDTTDPVINYVALDDYYIQTTQNVTYTVNVSGEDNTTLASVTAEGNNLTWNGTYWTGNGTTDADGVVNVTATDNAGNIGTNTSVTYTIDDNSLAISGETVNGENLSTSPNITNATGDVIFNWTVTETNLTSTNITIDGALANTSSSSGVNSYSTTLAPGLHTVVFAAIDDADNTVTSSTYSFRVNSQMNIDDLMNEIIGGNITNATLELSNGTDLNGTQWLNETVTLNMTINLNETNTSVEIINFTGLDANWNMTNFTVDVDNNSIYAINTEANSGTDIVKIILFQGVAHFLAEDDFDFGARVRIRNYSIDNLTIIYIANDNGTEVWNINQICSVSGPGVGVAITTDNMCYNFTNATKSTIIWIPHLSGVALADDTSIPDITMNEPTEAGISDSYFAYNITVIEANPPSSGTFCWFNLTTPLTSYKYNVGIGDFTETSSGWDYVRTTRFTRLTDGNYNMTTNCTDANNQSSQNVTVFTVNDTTTPSVTFGTPSVTDDDASIVITTADYDYINYTIEYSTDSDNLSSTESSTTFASGHTIELEDLDADTRYYYDISACDVNGNCDSSGVLNFRTAEEEEEESTTTPTFDTPVTESETVSRFWQTILQGEEQSMPIDNVNIAFTEISFTTNKDLVDVRLRVTAKESNPTTVDVDVDDVYKYFELIPTGLANEDLTSAAMAFRITKTWMIDNNVDEDSIALYRYASGRWYRLTTTKKTADSTYHNYEAATPGFSFFVIAGEDLPEGTNESTNQSSVNITIDPVTDDAGTGTNDSGTGDDGTDDGDGEKKKREAALIWFFIILVLIVAYIVYLFWANHKLKAEKKPKHPKGGKPKHPKGEKKPKHPIHHQAGALPGGEHPPQDEAHHDSEHPPQTEPPS